MNYKNYKLQLNNILANLSTILQPMNFDRTARSSWSSCFRLPTFSEEPYFIWSFGPPADEITLEDLTLNANEMRTNAVQSFTKHTPDPRLNSVKFGKTMDLVRLALGLNGKSFAPLDINDAVEASAKTTSTGFPDYEKKTNVAEQTKEQAVKVWSERDTSFTDIPVTLAWRTQVRKSGMKYRLIWLVPYIVVIFETILFLPIITSISFLRTSSYCIGNVFNDLSQRYNYLQKYSNIYSLDYSAFDASISPFFINLFFSFNKEHLNLNYSHNWLFEQVRIFHLNAMVITGSEGQVNIFRKRNGLLSGSLVTNYLGSFVNLFCIIYFLVDHDIEVDVKAINVMGDDSLFGLTEHFDIAYISDYFFSKFGIVVSISKSDIYYPGEPVFFLGAFIDSNKRYINFDLIKEQLKITTSFNTEITQFDRVFSKLCSSLFKYTDGWMYFDQEIPKLLQYFGVSSVPPFYLDVSTPAGGPISGNKLRSVHDFKHNGWRLQ